jgi:hypothetical protein
VEHGLPALLTYMVKDSALKSGIHNPRFGHTLTKKMDKLGIGGKVAADSSQSAYRK